MSAVDVLAVLDAEIVRNIERGAAKGSRVIRDLREARAAVAELMEAAEAHLDADHRADYGSPADMDAYRIADRLSAALARVQGGKS